MDIHFPEDKMKEFKKRWKEQITEKEIKHIAKEISKYC